MAENPTVPDSGASSGDGAATAQTAATENAAGSEIAQLRAKLEAEEQRAQEAERKFNQLLSQKSNYERRHQASSQETNAAVEYQAMVADLQAQANDPDPAIANLAKRQLQQLRILETVVAHGEQTRLEDAFERQLAAMPGDIRDEVRTLFNENRNRFGDPDAAREALIGRKYAARENDLKRREKEIQDALDAKKRGVADVAVRGVSSDDTLTKKPQLKRADYLERVRSGDRELIDLKDAGKVEIID